VALTFDAGSDAGNTARILDLLADDHIPATFGVTGAWAQANPGLLLRIVRSGHQIVNHTFDHRSFTGVSTGSPPLTSGQRIDELNRAETAIQAIAGTGTGGWFRPPYGDRNASVDADAGAAGYRYDLMWTVDSLGWQGSPAASVVARCLAAAEPGAILLLHVGTASTDADALRGIVDGLRAAGYGFATAAGLLVSGG
jgi:peptidoglycan/xylan/chitin deacetylase (PgdA/CDA1 family)